MTRVNGTDRVLTGWGRTAPSRAYVAGPMEKSQLQEIIAAHPARGVLARGAGRSYGDAAQNAGGYILAPVTRPRMEVDAGAATLRVSASTTFTEVLEHIVPQGLLLPVLPQCGSRRAGWPIWTRCCPPWTAPRIGTWSPGSTPRLTAGPSGAASSTSAITSPSQVPETRLAWLTGRAGTAARRPRHFPCSTRSRPARSTASGIAGHRGNRPASPAWPPYLCPAGCDLGLESRAGPARLPPVPVRGAERS